MSRLQNLYTELITNRRPELDKWYTGYKALTADTSRIGAALRAGKTLADKESYAGTSFQNEADPTNAFLTKLIYSDDNGVSNVGLSLLSLTTFEQLVANADFMSALERVLRAPVRESFDGFHKSWERVVTDISAKRTPLRINRVVAACTTFVSTHLGTV